MNCLSYVDMNMVRAGVAEHPEQWPWCGYDELMGRRQRYRIIDIDRLRQSLDIPDAASLELLHRERIAIQVERGELSRRPHWTEAVDVSAANPRPALIRARPSKLLRLLVSVPVQRPPRRYITLRTMVPTK